MKFQRDSILSLIVGGVLVILLPLLAALQYRWLGQVSSGEREQMKANLRATATRISEDFDQVLTETFVAFLATADDPGNEKDYVGKYQRWLETTRDERLVKTLYLAQAKENDELELRQFNPATKQFSPQPWSEELTSLQQNLVQHLSEFHRFTLQPAPEGSPPRPPFQALQRFNSNLPAITIPLVKMPFPGSLAQPVITGFVIVTLDLPYIQQEVLPALVKKHFVSDDVLNYDLAVIAHEQKQKIIWQSPNADFVAHGVSNIDISEPLFGLRRDEFRNLMRNRFEGRNPPPRRISGLFPFPNRDENKAWELLIRHRSGSLETAVTKIRHRNLMISFSILAMLLGSVGLMMMAVRRAKKLSQQQMDFVAGVSHELRTPLAVIDSAGYNLTKGVIKEPAQIERYGQLIRKESQRLKEMVEQMLEFAGVQSGKQQYALQPTNVNEILAGVLTSSQPLFTEGNFHLEKDIAVPLPSVLADAPALARALHNLLNNAMKYGGESRWIGVQAQAVTNGNGKKVQVTISDRGPGISAADSAHIFEPFYRGSEVRAAQIHGNGLGLSLVKNIIEAHHGQITVESKNGAGSAFIISLPTISENQSL